MRQSLCAPCMRGSRSQERQILEDESLRWDACNVILHTMRRLDRAIRKNGAATTAAALLK